MQKIMTDGQRKIFSLILSLLIFCGLWVSPSAFADEQFSDSSLPSLTDSVLEDGIPADDLFDEYGFRYSSQDLRHEALAGSEDFIDMGSATGIDLKKTWTIKFSRGVSIDKDVELIAILRPGSKEFIPVRINIGTTSNHITVSPVDKFSGNNDYELRVILRNGKRYKKSFRTVSENREADIEPNNLLVNASELFLNEIISGSNADDGSNYSVDFYKIQIPEYGYLDLTMKSTINKIFRFYNSLDGNRLFDDTGYIHDWSIPVSPGTYYIAVMKDYRSDLGFPYTLENRFTPTTMPGDEASHSYVLAPEIAFDRPIQGLLGFYNDQGGQNLNDYYKIVLDQPAKLRIKGSDLKGKSFRMDLYGERGTDGRSLAYSEAIVPLIQKTLPAGTYYLRIRDDDYSSSWKSLQYELQVSRQ